MMPHGIARALRAGGAERPARSIPFDLSLLEERREPWLGW
jgi:hypothetical protein